MALDFPTSPTNGQVYGAYVYDSSITAWRSKGVAQAATYVSDTAPSGAVQGDMWYRSTDGTTYVYYKDADTSQWVEIRSEIATSQVGLVPVVPTSVTLSAGSSSVSSTGNVTVSSANIVRLNGVFSGAFTNYRIVFSASATQNGTNWGTIRLSQSGTEDGSSNYDNVLLAFGASDTSTTKQSGLTNSSFIYFNYLDANSHAVLDVIKPFQATKTTFNIASWYSTVTQWGGGRNNTTSQYDGISITIQGSQTFSGTIQVYGYR